MTRLSLVGPALADGPRRVSLLLHKFSRGGSDRVAAHLARGFAEAGVDVDLIVFARGGEVETVLSTLVGRDIPIHYAIRAHGPRALDLLRGLPGVVRRLRARAPDVVISTANNTAWVSVLAVRLAGLPTCRLFLKTTNPIASSRHRGFVRRLRLWGYAVAFRATTAVWTLSPQESAEMRAEFPRFAPLFRDVVNPYVTPQMLALRPGRAGPAGPCVITLARLTGQKRLDRLISAFAHVRTPGARLTILGEGEDRPALTALVGRLGLENRVTLPGYAPDVAAALHGADLFVLTSDYEGLPAGVLEAMAANCPVLATDCFPSARALMGASEGCAIIEDASPAALAAQIDDALARPRPTGLRQVAERYSIANGVASHLAELTRG